MLSIITVCFNSEDTIKNCFASVENLSSFDIEHIIIDGNSSDGTVDLIKDYSISKSYKISWISEADLGIFDAYNKGIKLANEEYVIFLNSDDEILREDFVSLFSRIEQNSDIDVWYGSINYVDLKGGVSRLNSKFSLQMMLLKGMCFQHPSIVFKKNLFESINFNPSFKVIGDYDHMLRLMLSKYILFKCHNCTTTRMHAGGVSDGSYKQRLVEGYKSHRVHFNPIISFLFLLSRMGYMSLSKLKKYIC
jgi:glycosyltransferase involved in cell wall biosynthesis